MRKDRILDKLGEMEVTGKWNWFHTNRFGKELMLELIKYRIDIFKDFEINNEQTKFRKIFPYKAPLHNDITVKLEFIADEGQLTEKEKNLPDPEWKSYSKAQWDKLIGRK